MKTDRPLLGICLMLGFCILAPVSDSIAKILGNWMSVMQLVTIRFAIQIGILLPLIWFSGRTLRMSRRVFVLTMVRTGLHIIGIGSMFLSLRFLPIADAIAIAFVMPFIMLLLGKTILNEEVGRYRLVACGVGFIGTVLVIQPNFASVGPPALLPLLVAVAFAFFMLVTRQIAKECDPVSLQAVSGLMAVAVLLPAWGMGAETGWPGFGYTIPVGTDWVLLLLLGGLGTSAHLLMTWSLRFAPAATLAPMQYLEIPAATFVGWLVFKDLPNGLAAMGIAITVAAGLYIIYRERLNAAAMRSAPQVVPPAAE